MTEFDLKLVVDKEKRADIFLAEKLGRSRNQIQKMIEEKCVVLNGKILQKKSEILKPGDILEVKLPEEKTFTLRKENIPLEVIWEDEDYIVINKPAGIAVHPSPKYTEGTVVNAILENIDFDELETFSFEDVVKGRVRPGIVHRLDKDVSGVLLIAKNSKALERASEAFRERKVQKFYIAICFGVTEKKEWEIRKNIKRSRSDHKIMTVGKDGKEAITYVKVIRVNPKFKLTLFGVKPITGRTHQIRVHLSSEGFPIVKDEIYGGGGRKLEELQKVLGKFDFEGIFLHARSLEIFGKKFVAPFPKYFEELILKVFGQDALDEL